MAMMTGDVYATTLDHPVFLPTDRSLNPFSDRFIQRVINMDRQKLYNIPQMDDDEFLLELMHNDDTLGGSLSRAMEDDPYEVIFDDKLDDQLTLQDNIDGEWVYLMSAGPLTVNYIGNLLVLASKRDFPLTPPPHFTFQYIKDPSSFKATLAQVAGSMFAALHGAHTAMDSIQLKVQQVPGHVKTALKIVLAGSPMIIEMMLPNTLNTIGRIANESASLARRTFDKFSSVQELIAEIIEANTNTHSSQTNIVAQIQAQIDNAKDEQQNLNNNINSITSQYDDARRELEKAREEYQLAYNSIPTVRGWFKKIFRKIINVVVAIVTAPLRILGCVLGLCYNNQAALQAAQAAAETAKQNAIAKANHLRQLLEEAEKRHAAFAQQQAAEQQKLIDIINKIAALDLDRLSEKEIMDILIESILQMNQIKEQWGRLIQFFSKLTIQADSTQQIIVHEFINAIKDAQAHNVLIEPSDRELFVEILSITCQEIERGAHLLYVMSKTYYDISSDYMIGQVLSMDKLLQLQTSSERSAQLRLISSNTTLISTKVMQLAQSRQNEYNIRNKARREEYERFLAQVAEEDLEGSIG
ncbi:unnamed protein product [Adineta steineri]|uniref:Uncharacterized protein n=1 Tax=Adineta steineri TaxID=433720 RepID=A0A814WSM4_9BILA|nr:unnamed protein product [Adineta steineri]CAF1205695.1 unnamed protein product [Adineta steineri]